MIWLTQEERTRFATFLRESAESDAGMADLMAQTKMPEALVDHLRTKATAKKLVAHELETTSEETIAKRAVE